MSEEIPLEGGNVTGGVVRVGDTVRRPTGPQSPAVHALLRHLEEVEFEHSPRLLGVDDRGREILTFHEGSIAQTLDTFFNSDNLTRAARLVRALHDAVASFTPPVDSVWWDGCVDPAGDNLVLHGDLGPWNLVVGPDGWTLIDWDSACLGRREWELAYAVLTFAPLHEGQPDDDLAATQIRAFLDAYELAPDRWRTVLELIPARCWAVVDLILDRAALGDETFAKLRDGGHLERWRQRGEWADAQVPKWMKLVGC